MACKSIIVTFLNEKHNTKVNLRIAAENYYINMDSVDYLYTDPILIIKNLTKHQKRQLNKLCKIKKCSCKIEGKLHSNVVRINNNFNAYLHDKWVLFNIQGYKKYGERWKHYSRYNDKIN
jgi:hypothetical protein